MTFIAREEPFMCEHCSASTQPLRQGTYRNHCPTCLYSKHVDKEGPGDRASTCRGLMKPISLDKRHGEWSVLHECISCGKQGWNIAAPDDDLVALSENLAK